MKRYHSVLVVLHWLLALMIVTGLIMGGKVLAATPNAAPEKLFYLKMHMSGGMTILVLMIVRLLLRFVTTKPPHADIGHTLVNKLGVATHYVFYLVVILMAASGIAIANIAGLADIVFGQSGASLPETFDDLPPRMAHGFLGFVLTVLITGHVLAFLYHQYVRKDGLFSRMWFGDRG
jgi:cytochrome b561